MTALLPKDANGETIPAVALIDGAAHSISSSAAAARNSTAFASDTKIVSVYADQDVYLKFGDDTVTATTSDHFFPGSVYYDFALRGKTHLSVLRVTDDGTVYVSEKE